MSKFKVGDKVKYISNNHGDEKRNPLWGKSQGKIVGKITVIQVNGWYKVEWENGENNTYEDNDLELVGKDKPEKPFKFILIYDKTCGDPKEYFHTLAEGQKRMRELAKDKDVIVDSMDLIEIANRWKVTPSIIISKVKN